MSYNASGDTTKDNLIRFLQSLPTDFFPAKLHIQHTRADMGMTGSPDVRIVGADYHLVINWSVIDHQHDPQADRDMAKDLLFQRFAST